MIKTFRRYLSPSSFMNFHHPFHYYKKTKRENINIKHKLTKEKEKDISETFLSNIKIVHLKTLTLILKILQSSTKIKVKICLASQLKSEFDFALFLLTLMYLLSIFHNLKLNITVNVFLLYMIFQRFLRMIFLKINLCTIQFFVYFVVFFHFFFA